MKIQDLNQSEEQHSLEWFRSREGLITGSEIAKLMGNGRGSKRWTDTAVTYMLNRAFGATELDDEVLGDDDAYGERVEDQQIGGKDIDRGKQQEYMARQALDAYLEDFIGDVRIEEVGSIRHPEVPYADSPDGVIVHADTDEIVACCEFKCPRDENFMRYKVFVRENKNKDAGAALKRVEKKYYYQCQAHMDLTGTNTCYFCWYHKHAKSVMGVVRIRRNQKDIDEMHQTIREAYEIIQGGCESLYVEED